MMFIALVCFAALGALYLTAPKRYAVHGSSPKRLPDGMGALDRWMPGLIFDDHGRLFNADGRFVGKAVRDSMAASGIPDGTTFTGDYLNERTRRELEPG